MVIVCYCASDYLGYVSCGLTWNAYEKMSTNLESPWLNCKHDHILWVLESSSLICVLLFRDFKHMYCNAIQFHSINSINIADINWPADVNRFLSNLPSRLLVLARRRRIIWVICPEFRDQLVLLSFKQLCFKEARSVCAYLLKIGWVILEKNILKSVSTTSCGANSWDHEYDTMTPAQLAPLSMYMAMAMYIMAKAKQWWLQP